MPAEPIPDFLYGTAWKENRTAALTELALRTGFRGIDTANQRRHYFEAGVGEGLATAYRAGIVTRADLFLQTKFTYQRGQDHRLPYDPAAPLADQVAQSLASSLEHLGTDHVDSFVLHGPSSGYDWTDADAEVWEAMRKERDAGRTRLLGVSNVSLQQVEQMEAAQSELPAFVQNRCFARLGWDREGALVLQPAQDSLSGIFSAHCESRSAAAFSADRCRCPDERNSGSVGVRLRARARHTAIDRHVQRRPHESRSRQLEAGAFARTRAGDGIDCRLTVVTASA